MSKTILITGTSSGIGKTTAKFFQQKGWNVIATMRSPHKEEESTNLDNVLVTRLDVQDPSSITAAVEEGIAKFGKIDVLLNNAGVRLVRRARGYADGEDPPTVRCERHRSARHDASRAAAFSRQQGRRHR